MAQSLRENQINTDSSELEKEHRHDTFSEPNNLDSRIKYPSYKSFDEFIDVERLKSLDDYISERIKQHIATNSEEFFLNAYRLDADSPHAPGAREIWLSRPAAGEASAYDDFDKTEIWEPTEETRKFPLLMDFIKTLPFKAMSRILIIYDDAATSVPAHRDHLNTEICHEFLWMRTNKKKPFYMLNHKTGEKKYVETYTAWFDSVNQFHGTDPYDGLSFSIRVDGFFSDEFRKRIPVPEFNPASTPSFWASV